MTLGHFAIAFIVAVLLIRWAFCKQRDMDRRDDPVDQTSPQIRQFKTEYIARATAGRDV